MVLIEGGAATVHGWGFSPLARENDVFVGGLRAPVLSSTATRLSITVPRADCLPPREVVLRVSTTAGRDSIAVGSTPLSAEDRDWPRFEWRHTSSGDGCIHLPGDAEGGEFLIGVTSVSEDPSHLVPVTLAGTPGTPRIVSASEGLAAPRAGRVAHYRYAAPLVPASGRVGPPPSVAGRRGSGVPRRRGTAWSDWFAVQAEAMARNQALLRELGRPDWSAGPSQAVVARSSLSKGDTVTLKTGWNAETLVDVRSVVRFVGDHMVWLDDVANPGEPFTDAELMEQDAFYSSHVKPVNEAYFGSLSDVDGNGRFLVLMTVEMNRRGISGEANPCHQFPRSQCHFSNEAEFMAIRAPDPDGLYGHAVSRESVLSFLPYFLAHEVTHIVQYSETLLAGLPRKRDWELEGGAEMAVLRFAMDRWGGQDPGGEKALLKRLTQSPLIGFANLVDVSPGWSIERILGEFYVTLWLEGTAGRDTPGMTSWDIHDIVSRFDAEQWLKPYSSSSATPSVSARIRGASTMYFHWTPDGPLRPTSFKVEPADDGPVFVWAIRAR